MLHWIVVAIAGIGAADSATGFAPLPSSVANLSHSVTSMAREESRSSARPRSMMLAPPIDIASPLRNGMIASFQVLPNAAIGIGRFNGPRKISRFSSEQPLLPEVKSGRKTAIGFSLKF